MDPDYFPLCLSPRVSNISSSLIFPSQLPFKKSSLRSTLSHSQVFLICSTTPSFSPLGLLFFPSSLGKISSTLALSAGLWALSKGSNNVLCLLLVQLLCTQTQSPAANTAQMMAFANLPDQQRQPQL